MIGGIAGGAISHSLAQQEGREVETVESVISEVEVAPSTSVEVERVYQWRSNQFSEDDLRAIQDEIEQLANEMKDSNGDRAALRERLLQLKERLANGARAYLEFETMPLLGSARDLWSSARDIQLEFEKNRLEQVVTLASNPGFGGHAPSGTFQVTSSEFGPLMIDTRTGATWVLKKGEGDKLGWQEVSGPMQRPPVRGSGHPQVHLEELKEALETMREQDSRMRDAWERDMPPRSTEAAPSGVKLGVTVAEVKDGDGLRITGITEGSPAEFAGLRVGDVITEADDDEMETFEDLRDLMASKDADDRVKLTVSRTAKLRDGGTVTSSFVVELDLNAGSSNKRR